MAITIPSLPTGELGTIYDPNDLYNDSYNQLPNLRWSDPELHDRIAWLSERIPFTITRWDAPYAGPAGPGAGAKEHRGSTHFQVKLSKSGAGYAVDVVNIATDPRSAFTTLYFLDHGINAPEIALYPGFLVRNPVGGKGPVGEPWPEHSRNAKNRKVHRVSAVFTPEDWPYTVDPNTGRGTEFERTDGRYTLQREWSPGSGLWGSGGSWTYRWEKDYSR